MPAQLTDCASLLQFALGLNILVPAAVIRYARVQEAAEKSISAAVEQTGSNKPGYRLHAINAVTKIKTMRMRRRFFFLIFTPSAVSLIISFVGLVSAAEHPRATISDSLVDIYAICSIIIAPGLCGSWMTVTDKLEDEIRQVISLEDPEAISRLVGAFETILQMQDIGRSTSFKLRWKLFKALRKNRGSIAAFRQVIGRRYQKLPKITDMGTVHIK